MTVDATGGFLKRIEYISVNDKTNTELINDDITLNATKSTEIKNNILQITLRNNASQYDGTYIYGKNVNADTYSLKYQEEDMFSLYLKHTNDGTDYNDSTWATSDYLVGEFMLKEIGYNSSEADTRITLKCVDRAYTIFNIVFSYSYGINTTWTAPGMLRNALRINAEAIDTNIKTFTGTGNDSGVSYQMDMRFTSEGGYIEDMRRIRTDNNPDTYSYDAETTLNGALNSSDTTITVISTTGFEESGTLVISDGTTTEHIKYTGITATTFTGCTRGIDDTGGQSHSDSTKVYQGFPEILLSKSWKPLFEWVSDISQSSYTNYPDEVAEGGTEYFNRAFIFWIDKQNAVHWMNADDQVDSEIILGEEDFKAMRLEKSVFDSVNFVIYNAGEDMYGNGILFYWYDENSDASGLKMRYQPMTEIVHNLVRNDINNNNTSRDTTKTQDELKQFPSSYPITSWAFKEESNNFRNYIGSTARTSLANDSEYNESLREAAKWTGLVESQEITAKTSGLRYKGNIILKGQHFNPGDLVEVTDRVTGQVSQKVRVMNVRHTVNQNGWTTNLDVEEDEKVV